MPGPGAHKTDQALADFLATKADLTGGTLPLSELPAHASTHLPGGSDALGTAAAGASNPGDTASAGTAASFARSDHVHAREQLAVTCSQPTADQTVPANATTIVSGDPLVPASGTAIILPAGALVILDPRDGNETWPQLDPTPKNDMRVFGAAGAVGNQVRLTGRDVPLQIDAGRLVDVGDGALISLDARLDDVYSGFVSSRPGRSVTQPWYSTVTAGGPFILDSGVLYELPADPDRSVLLSVA